MGSQCCIRKVRETSNESENHIRETINQMPIIFLKFNQFDAIFRQITQMSVLDIDILSRWIVLEDYDELLKKLINRKSEYQFDQELILKSIDDEDFIYLIFYLTNSCEKIFIIEKLLRKHFSIMNFGNFKKFLGRYLEVSLIKLTAFFIKSLRISADLSMNSQLNHIQNTIFNEQNLQKFLKLLFDEMKIIIKIKNPFLREKDLDSEFLFRDDIRLFFNENEFLLDPLELREMYWQKAEKIFYLNNSFACANINDSFVCKSFS